MQQSSKLRSRMIERHRILIRNCDSYEGLAQGRYDRVAVRSSVDNVRLTQALAEELRSMMSLLGKNASPPSTAGSTRSQDPTRPRKNGINSNSPNRQAVLGASKRLPIAVRRFARAWR